MNLFRYGYYEGNSAKDWAEFYWPAQGKYEKLRDCVDEVQTIEEIESCRLYVLE